MKVCPLTGDNCWRRDCALWLPSGYIITFDKKGNETERTPLDGSYCGLLRRGGGGS